MKVYVLHFMDYYYELESEYIIGVFSTLEKARDEKEKYMNDFKKRNQWDNHSCDLRIFEHVLDLPHPHPQENLPL